MDGQGGRQNSVAEAVKYVTFLEQTYCYFHLSGVSLASFCMTFLYFLIYREKNIMKIKLPSLIPVMFELFERNFHMYEISFLCWEELYTLLVASTHKACISGTAFTYGVDCISTNGFISQTIRGVINPYLNAPGGHISNNDNN